jgi:hypothetical protein
MAGRRLRYERRIAPIARETELAAIDEAIRDGTRYRRITLAEAVAHDAARETAWSDRSARFALLCRLYWRNAARHYT